jgi:hypothetical protein
MAEYLGSCPTGPTGCSNTTTQILGTNHIDGSMVCLDGSGKTCTASTVSPTYYLFFKDETSKKIGYATSITMAGTYAIVSSDIGIGIAEAPALICMDNPSNCTTWALYTEQYNAGTGEQISTTATFPTGWTSPVQLAWNGQTQNNLHHAAVIKVYDQAVARMIAATSGGSAGTLLTTDLAYSLYNPPPLSSSVNNVNGGNPVSMLNPSTGSNAYSVFSVGQTSGSPYQNFNVNYDNSGFSTTGLTIANSGLLSSGAGATGGLIIRTDASAPILFGTGGTERMRIINTGNVGIGTTSPQYLLHVGSASVSGVVSRFQNSAGTCDINPTTTSLSCSSDARLKKNVATMDDQLAKLLGLRPVMFNWNSETATSSAHPGFIAQEVETTFPELVSTDASGYKSIGYSNFVPYLVSGIQALDQKLQALQGSFTNNVTATNLSVCNPG